ncbi:MAG: hypothetical protein ACOVQ2_03280 [Flavobacterium sp.]
MRKLFLLISITLISCQDKEIQLPKTQTSHTLEVLDQTMVYIFFETKGKDTIAITNRKNTVSTTNWIFNIDKRLKMKHIIPELLKLQKKRESVSFHKNENAKNYMAYSDTLHKNWSFLDFTKTKFFMIQSIPKTEKGNLALIKSKNQIEFMGEIYGLVDFKKQMNLIIDRKIDFIYNKNMTYQDYLWVNSNVKIDLHYPVIANEEYFY